MTYKIVIVSPYGMVRSHVDKGIATRAEAERIRDDYIKAERRKAGLRNYRRRVTTVEIREER